MIGETEFRMVGTHHKEEGRALSTEISLKKLKNLKCCNSFIILLQRFIPPQGYSTLPLDVKITTAAIESKTSNRPQIFLCPQKGFLL
jgi:hypothetical protein